MPYWTDARIRSSLNRFRGDDEANQFCSRATTGNLVRCRPKCSRNGVAMQRPPGDGGIDPFDAIA